jgi:hypothetical protein
LSHDEALRETVEQTRNEREREKLDEQRSALTLQDDLTYLLNLVNEGEAGASKDADKLAALRSIGEDVDEAESIVEERRAWAEVTRNKINELMERIGGRVTESTTRVTASRRLSNNVDHNNVPRWPDDAKRYVHPGPMVEARFQGLVGTFGPTNPAGWIGAGNPLYSTGALKWMFNCGSCSRAFADTYQGKSVEPAMGDDRDPPGEYQEMWDALGTRPTSHMTNAHANPADFQASAFQALEASLEREGPGAVAIIGVDWDIPGQPREFSGGHWFNAYVDRNGKVKWADLQTGALGDWPPSYKTDIWRIEAVARQYADSPWKELVL